MEEKQALEIVKAMIEIQNQFISKIDTQTSQIMEVINGLYKNQEVLNSKIDALLIAIELISKAVENILETSKGNSQTMNIVSNYLRELKAQSADVQIMIQNSNGDHDSIVGMVQDVSTKVDEVTRLINEWKLYSEL